MPNSTQESASRTILKQFHSIRSERSRFGSLPRLSVDCGFGDSHQISKLETPDERAWQCLGAVDEQMMAIERQWRADRFTLVTPPFILARSALINAATAYWVLVADDALERSVRTLLVTKKDFSDSEATHNDFIDSKGLAPIIPEEVLKAARRDREEIRHAIRKAKKELSRLGVGDRQMLSETQLISKAAVELASGATPDDQAYVGFAAVRAWRQASAMTHGRRWALMPLGQLIEDANGRIVQINTQADLDEVAEILVLVAKLYTASWARFDALAAPRTERGASFVAAARNV